MLSALNSVITSLSIYSPPQIQISLDEEQEQEKLACFRENNLIQLPLYKPKDHNISGKVCIHAKKGSKLSYKGLKIELIGRTTANYGNKTAKQEFLVLSQRISTKSELLDEDKSIPFLFSLDDIGTKYETYDGVNVNIRYLLRATLEMNFGRYIIEEQEFVLHIPIERSLVYDSFKLNLRIADFLITDVELGRTDYYLDDCISGKIIIERMQLRLEKIQVGLIKREIINVFGSYAIKNDEIIARRTVFEGNPKEGDMLPFKIHLSPYNLSPNLKEAHPKYILKYMLAVSFQDDQGRSLFKHIEIGLWRRN